ncbi:MAG TPA: type IX secretion system sortase PorU [Cyclobacteriaceae bacterium]|nr:type IX secretion system sortase PorU [Cyclobacteriaceae bacterium]
MNRIAIILLSLWTIGAYGQSASVLSTGKWAKASVQFDGVYKIDFSLLKKMGINPDGADARKIRIFAAFNAMLPQANSAPRIKDLQEIAIYVKGEEDGKFDNSDYILFYGQGPDNYNLLPSKSIFQYENNLYSDKNYYFITIGTLPGKRIAQINNVSGDAPSIEEFDDFAYYETEKYNVLNSGRDWFGEQFDSKTEYTIRFDMPGIVAGSDIKLVCNTMAQSYNESSFQILYNDKIIAEQKPLPISDYQYAVKGSEVIDTLKISANLVNASGGAAQDIKLQFVKAASGISVGYLDYLLLQAKRRLAFYGDQILFHSLKSLDQPLARFSISNSTSETVVWDITDPFNPSFQQSVFSGGVTTFTASSGTLRKYIAWNTKFSAPGCEEEILNQNLHGLAAVDVLVVCAPEFISQAQRFALHRQSKNSLRVSVVTTNQVYNEFSGGKQDITAIRDYVKYLRDQNAGIKHLLLFGRGSYDYKNYLPNNKNFVPTYESRNSLSPLETYSSDDYFGFLENNEGNWGESPSVDHTLDIGVGRLPVKKTEEADIVVDKIIEYENQNWGEWRKELVFVADDGDYNIHQSQSDELAETIESSHPEFNTTKIFLDSYKQVNSSIGQLSPDATAALNDAVRKGAAVVNYTGHGSEQQWTQERIFDQTALDKWKTAPAYPLLVTATCEFGRNDDPSLISTAENSLVRKGGGSIGLVTTARPVNSSTNFTLNKAFYLALFTKVDNQFRDLGSVFRDTKNNSTSGVANRNFSLLGDPSMHVILPGPEIKVSEIKNLSSPSDTLKALSSVRITGSIYQNGVPDTNFNGNAQITLVDRPVLDTTKGDENSPFQFTNRTNEIFRGQAQVTNGQFKLEFTMTSSINPVVGNGKLSLYAYSNGSKPDVAGVVSAIKIGAKEKKPGADTKGPDIQLFVGDSTFLNGGIASASTHLVAILSDENGINISGYSEKNNILSTLDDSISFVLNNYYLADLGNVGRGKIRFPIDDLKPGEHHLSIRASDTFGNQSSTSITFFVSDVNGIQIEQWLNFPNPASTSTTFHFKHNRSGDDLEAVVTVYNYLGQPMVSNTYEVLNSPYHVNLPTWDVVAGEGTKLGTGLYLCKLSVRSLSDGSKNEKITKVIISN